jgi:hypothetical protein
MRSDADVLVPEKIGTQLLPFEVGGERPHTEHLTVVPCHAALAPHGVSLSLPARN